jgi:hypothetical protein
VAAKAAAAKPIISAGETGMVLLGSYLQVVISKASPKHHNFFII